MLQMRSAWGKMIESNCSALSIKRGFVGEGTDSLSLAALDSSLLEGAFWSAHYYSVPQKPPS